MGISSSNLAGIDVNSIVSQLMQAESQPLKLLQQKEASYQARLSAFGTLSSALSTFQGAISALSDPTKFQNTIATPTDATVLTALTTPGATIGTYAVNTTQLAQAQALSSGGQTSTTTAIGSGAATTLTFSFGTISGGTLTNGVYSGASFTPNASSATATVTINNTNNTLQGIRDAINAANAGVTASIVNDGSGTPYHLALTSNQTGVANSMKISVSGDATLQSLLAYDPTATQNLTQTAVAQNAQLTVNGLAVTSATNTVTGALQGVTLNLLKVGSVNLNLARDTNSVQAAVNSFVSAYNSLHSTIAGLTSYDAKTGKSGQLIGDPTVQLIQNRVRQILNAQLTGTGSGAALLPLVGVTFQSNGTMAVDSSKLQNALTNNFSQIASLFSTVGTATDSLVSYVSAGPNTKAGSYGVQISTVASQGKLAGSAAASTTITAGVNDTLAVTIDNISATVKLSAGTYTASSLAAMVQAAVNGASALTSAGSAVTVTQSGGILTMTSNRYGSASSVAVSGTAASPLFGGAPTATAGVDVAGSIGGLPATGSGQYLTGKTGTAIDGLKLQIQGTTGNRGTLNFSQGYASQISALMSNFLGTGGAVPAATDSINQTIKNLQSQEATAQQRLTQIEQTYRKQFTALNATLVSLQQTSSYLTQQLAALPSASSQPKQ